MSGRDQRGSVIPLIAGLAAIALMLVGVVVDASAAFLRHQELDSLADAAALAATDGVQGDAVYTRGIGERLEIDPDEAAGFAAAYLRASGAEARYPGLTMSVSTSSDTVVVRLRAPIRLPLRVSGVAGETTVTSIAASQVVVDRRDGG